MTKRNYTQQSNSSDDFKKYIREINSHTQTNDKFKLTRFVGSFVIENIESIKFPTKVLRDCFQHCLDRTIRKSSEASMKLDRFGILVSSNLLSSDIYQPIRPINENTIEALLNLFNKVSQSKTSEGSFWGEPFTVTVVGINANNLNKRRRIVGMGKRHRLPFGVDRNIDEEACILKVKTLDFYFYFLFIDT